MIPRFILLVNGGVSSGDIFNLSFTKSFFFLFFYHKFYDFVLFCSKKLYKTLIIIKVFFSKNKKEELIK
jgi:DNA polymerase III alpha subunit (gram-positive type)